MRLIYIYIYGLSVVVNGSSPTLNWATRLPKFSLFDLAFNFRVSFRIGRSLVHAHCWQFIMSCYVMSFWETVFACMRGFDLYAYYFRGDILRTFFFGFGGSALDIFLFSKRSFISSFLLIGGIPVKSVAT